MENTKSEPYVNPLDALTPAQLCRNGLKVIAQVALDARAMPLDEDRIIATAHMCADVACRMGRISAAEPGLTSATVEAITNVADALALDILPADDRLQMAVRRCIFGAVEIGKVLTAEAAP